MKNFHKMVTSFYPNAQFWHSIFQSYEYEFFPTDAVGDVRNKYEVRIRLSWNLTFQDGDESIRIFSKILTFFERSYRPSCGILHTLEWVCAPFSALTGNMDQDFAKSLSNGGLSALFTACVNLVGWEPCQRKQIARPDKKQMCWLKSPGTSHWSYVLMQHSCSMIFLTWAGQISGIFWSMDFNSCWNLQCVMPQLGTWPPHFFWCTQCNVNPCKSVQPLVRFLARHFFAKLTLI